MGDRENRSYQRFLIRTGSCLLCGEGSGAIRDLSVGGMFIAYPGAFPVGTTFDIELRLGDQEIPVGGIVRRCIPGEGMGIEFQDMSSAVRARLKTFLVERIDDRARIVIPPSD